MRAAFFRDPAGNGRLAVLDPAQAFRPVVEKTATTLSIRVPVLPGRLYHLEHSHDLRQWSRLENLSVQLYNTPLYGIFKQTGRFYKCYHIRIYDNNPLFISGTRTSYPALCLFDFPYPLFGQSDGGGAANAAYR